MLQVANTIACMFVRQDFKISVLFTFFCQVFVVAILATLPFLPMNLSMKAFRLSLSGTAAASLYSLFTLYGVTSAVFVPWSN